MLYLSFYQKNLVSVIEGLCKGHGCLGRTEVIVFMDKIKQAKYPKNEETSKSLEVATKTEFYGKLTRQGLLNTNQSFARYTICSMYVYNNNIFWTLLCFIPAICSKLSDYGFISVASEKSISSLTLPNTAGFLEIWITTLSFTCTASIRNYLYRNNSVELIELLSFNKIGLV